MSDPTEGRRPHITEAQARDAFERMREFCAGHKQEWPAIAFCCWHDAMNAAYLHDQRAQTLWKALRWTLDVEDKADLEKCVAALKDNQGGPRIAAMLAGAELLLKEWEVQGE